MYQLRLIALPFLLLIFAGSCAEPSAPTAAAPSSPTETTSVAAEEIRRQSRIISRLTDEILKALATYDYQGLEQLINSSELGLSGAEAAVRLLGPRASTMVLGPWDAQEIEVSFNDDLLQAAATANVTYRLSMNRKPQSAIFTFHFHRSNRQGSWRLYIE